MNAVRSGSPALTRSHSADNTFPSTHSRLSAFLASRRDSLFGSRGATPTRSQSARTLSPTLPLEEQLAYERQARELAEEKAAQVTAELEELTQSLFEEANSMVRIEREKCARLESRLHLMESREEDKRRRLTELEKAVGRITRVRGVLDKGSVVQPMRQSMATVTH